MSPLIRRSFLNALEKTAFNQEQIRQQGVQMVQRGTAMQQNPLAAMAQIRQQAALTANNPAAKPAQAAHMMSLVQSTQPSLHKTAADTGVLRRAARKLVFNNRKLRQRVRKYTPRGTYSPTEHKVRVDAARNQLKGVLASPETKHLDWFDDETLQSLIQLRDKGPTLPAGGYSRLATAKKEMPDWIRKAKAEAHTAGEPRAWRDYLPRHVDRLQRDKAHLNEAKKLRESAPQQIAEIMERARASKRGEVLAARDNLGRVAGGGGVASFDPRKNKIMVEGFREAHPAQRATSALHEFNEFLEAKRYAKKGRPFDQIKTTNQVLGPGNVHANATLPVRDLNIARTVTGDGAELVREEFENLRAMELDAMKRKMPQLAPMLEQLEGRGKVYGKSSSSKALTRAQSILSSGKGSPALRGRAQKIVDTHAAGQVPNVRLNRREVSHVRDTYDKMFQRPVW